MGKVKVKNNNISGFRIAVMIISILLLSLFMAFSMLLGVASFKNNGPVVAGNDATTVRKKPPKDGTLPTGITDPLDNIGHMAYVLDNQPSYHVYAYNSTRSMGYEQVTQSWKDYKDAGLSGAGEGVMVCSDLSYSGLVQSSSQSCFIGNNEAHVRRGKKPGSKNTKPLDIEWADGEPVNYNADEYKLVYGEFSTEISVYVINEDTFVRADDVIDNGDGTYSQKFYLNEKASCWYQYGMKTRGDLKTFPEFRKIEITFTFDGDWRLLSSYCEENAIINPRALGGMDADSNSKTTTTYDYSQEGFDNAHYAYYNDFFKKYQGSTGGNSSQPAEKEIEITDVLMGGFGKVLGDGQQFDISLTLGSNAYEGKVFLKLPGLENILDVIDARVALGKKGSGTQDFYAEFKEGKINVYYSTDFALTCNVNELSQWLSGINSGPAVHSDGAEESGGGLDIGSVLNAMNLGLSETEAFITLKSDDLMGMGLGVDVVFGFNRVREDEGDVFSIKSLDLNYIGYEGDEIAVKAEIKPDADGAMPITRVPAQTPANLADYAESVYKLFNSNTVKISIGLDDKLIEGLTLTANSYLSIGSKISAYAEISAVYKGVSLKLDATYIYENTAYGKIYLHVSEFNGRAVNAKINCDIKDTVTAVKNLISLFASDGSVDSGTVTVPETGVKLATVINKVLNLDFSEIIGSVKGDGNSVSLEINVDKLLAGLDVSLGIDFGTLALKVVPGADGKPAVISGGVSGLGLDIIEITGSENILPEIDADGYVDINTYLESVYSLLKKPSYDIAVSLDGTEIADGIDLRGLKVNGVATVAVENGTVRVKLPVTISYKTVSLTLTAYYTVNLTDGSYGNVYLHVTQFNGKDVNAKVYCDIKDAVEGINGIIAKFVSGSGIAVTNEQSVLSNVIALLLKADYNEIINATNEKLNVTFDVDALLSALDISLGGVSFGELNLEFVPKTGVLNGSLEKLGLTVSLAGSNEPLAQFGGEGYVDVNSFISGIAGIVNSEVYEIGVKFDGGKISENIDLSGLTLDATAHAKLEDGYDKVTAVVNMLISYNGLEAELTAYYSADISANDFSTVYLEITRIDRTNISAKVYCDIKEAIDAVNDIINVFNPPVEYGDASDIISKLAGVVLNLDYAEIIRCSQEKLSVTLNVDEILSALGITLGGVEFGNLQLELDLNNGDAVISGKLDKLGAEMTLKGVDGYKMPVTNTDEYLDLTKAIRLVGKMIDEGKKIAEAEDVVFAVKGSASIGGVQVEISGNGEVIWADGTLKVALSLALTVEGEPLDINFVYDKDGDPFVIITINGAGVKISNAETDKLVNSIKGLIDAFTKSGPKDAENEADAYKMRSYSFEEIAGNENVKTVLNAILGFANELVAEIQTNPAGIYELLIKHTGGASVTLGADGCLSINFAKAESAVNASVEAGNGATVLSILNDIAVNEKTEENADGKYTFYELSEFTKILYNWFFDKIEDITLEEILGSKTYEVTVNLSGADSGISVLEGVSVNARLYYAEGLDGTRFANKLMHTELDLDINGTFVSVTAAYSGRTLFVELNKIGATAITGVKFKAGVEKVFDVAEELVRLITDTNFVETIGLLTGKGSVSADEIENIATFASVTDENGNSSTSALTKLIEAFLTLDLNKAFDFDAKTNTVKINLDAITEAVLGIRLGTITATCNGNTLSASLKNEDNGEWLSLNAAPCESRKDILNPDDYTDVDFLSTFISDIVGTVTDENNIIHRLYTFSGTITVNINIPVLSQTVEFKNATLTAGFDKNDKFYLTLAASMNGTLATKKSDISITYSDGLIVLGRGVETADKEFKVLTFEYFLDNILDKNNSPLQWLLGTDKTLWGLVVGFVKADIDSGLTKPKIYTLYEELKQNAKEGTFNLRDYLSGMCVNAGGLTSVYGNGASLAEEKFKLAEDSGHYAFDIDAGTLTDNVISKLCAVILRDEGGISGLKAFGAIDSYVEFTVDLSNYLEGATALYGDAENGKGLGETAVRNYLGYVTENYGFDRNHPFETTKEHITPVFGCYYTKDGSYISSDMLETVYLDIYSDINSAVPERTLEILYGSTVNLVSDFPEFADESKTSKLIYLGSDGVKLPNSIVITDESNLICDGRVSIYKSSEEAVEVVFNFVGISGMKPVSSAFADGETLSGYVLNDYSFLGWYSEADFVNKVETVDKNDAVNGKITLYGKYIKTVVAKENGIIYSYDAEIDAYFVSGVNSDISKYYNNAELWLVIDDNVNGYPVKYIGADAFAVADYSASGNSLVNVLVPETVTAVYDNAFLDNKGLRQAVFLAERVFFGGAADANKASVFYGCYTEVSDNVNKNFTIYINGTLDRNPYAHVATANENLSDLWNGIYYNSVIGIKTVYTAQVQSNGWVLANYVINTGNIDLDKYPYLAGLTSVNSGIDGVALTAQQIKARILEEINGKTAENDMFINGFEVSVSCGTAFGKYTEVYIDITEVSSPAYKITYSGEAYISGLIEYGGSYYASAENVYTVISNDGYEITFIEGVEAVKGEDGSYSFVMPFGALEIAVSCEKIKFDKITLISETAFILDGVEYTSGAEVSAEEGASMVGAPVAKDENYVFIGWAYKAGDNSYSFEGETVNYTVYYAVWAYKRTEIESLSSNGLSVVATVNEQAHSVYGWYADETFIGNALAICENNTAAFTSVTSTVVYARLYYNMAVTVSGTNSRDVVIDKTASVDGIPVNDKKVSSSKWPAKDLIASTQIAVLEGVQVRLRNADANKTAYYIQALYNGRYVDITGKIYITVSSGFGGMGTSETELYAYDKEGNAIDVTEKTEGSNDAFSTYFEVCGNTSFTVKNN